MHVSLFVWVKTSLTWCNGLKFTLYNYVRGEPIWMNHESITSTFDAFPLNSKMGLFDEMPEAWQRYISLRQVPDDIAGDAVKFALSSDVLSFPVTLVNGLKLLQSHDLCRFEDDATVTLHVVGAGELCKM